nr:uncharacterized protein LOC109180348 [Ipomoea trifida]
MVLGCLRWGWKRCTYIGSDESATWTTATGEEFDPVPRACCTILTVYEDDLRNPKFALAGGYRLDYAPNQGPPRQPPREADVRQQVHAPRALEGRDLVVEHRVRDSEDALGGEWDEL